MDMILNCEKNNVIVNSQHPRMEEDDVENLIDVQKNYLLGVDDKKDNNKYVNDIHAYVNRVNTYDLWNKKPIQLSPIILARNGFVCENERTIRCEMCNCKYVYEKDKYSRYTQIDDLCLLHRDNCPWKNTLLDLSILRLDESSLQREPMLEEYEHNVKLLQGALYEIPLINIEKTIKDLMCILKKHMENETVQKKYNIFNWYISVFKNHFTDIFSRHENVVKNASERIKKNFPEYEKYLVDLKFLNALEFSIEDEHNYINIVCDDVTELKEDREDLNMYFKIINKLKNYNYEDVNIFKLLSLFGWSYKGDSVCDNNHFTQVLYCKYCFREIKIGKYSNYSIRDHKVSLFKEIGPFEIQKVKEDLRTIRSRKQMSATCTNIDEHVTKIVDYVMMILNKNWNTTHGGSNNTSSHMLMDLKNVRSISNQGGDGNKDSALNNHNNNNNNTTSSKSSSDVNYQNTNSTSSTVGIHKKNPSLTKQEEIYSAIQWKKKELILTKKSKELFKDKRNTPSLLFNKSNRKAALGLHKNDTFFGCKNAESKENMSKKTLSKIYVDLYDYLSNQSPFVKTIYNYYVLANEEFLQYENQSSNQSTHNNTTTTVSTTNNKGSHQCTKKNVYSIRLFDLIENHRVYCPYMIEDLYGFSKITKLFFELLLSEFKRKYMFK